MSRYQNIDRFYDENKELLMESDDYRLCKSLPRNIGAYVEKFAVYYRIHRGGQNTCELSEDMITYDVLELKKSSTISRTFLFLYCFFYS
jgi:hypothetical protein